MLKKIIHFFDKLEDKVRHKLSRQPLWYALFGGIGVVLFWRGVWYTADYLFSETLAISSGGRLASNMENIILLDGIVSIVVGSTILLMTGVFVSSFIGNEVILSGLKGEKKIAEKTVEEVETELEKIREVEREVHNISKKLSKISKQIGEK